jgi:NADH-quinone oxidoreductase subunit J
MSAIFLIAGFVAIAAAAVAVTRENPIYTALFTLVALGAVAVEFVLLHSPFLGAMQILLYAGAIMVLFVFVIMLLSLKKEEHGEEPPVAAQVFAAAVAAALFLVLRQAARSYVPHGGPLVETDDALRMLQGSGQRVEFGSTEHFGTFLYGASLVPFELVSVLLTAALAGVLVLGKRRLSLGAEPAPEPKPAEHGVEAHS